MTRLWQNGDPVAIETNGLLPTAILLEGTWHPVEKTVLEWQVDVGWWRVRIYRDYFRILTSDGMLLVVYHDLLTDTWAVQRVYD